MNNDCTVAAASASSRVSLRISAVVVAVGVDVDDSAAVVGLVADHHRRVVGGKRIGSLPSLELEVSVVAFPK